MGLFMETAAVGALFLEMWGGRCRLPTLFSAAF
jgi:hypothetical protein